MLADAISGIRQYRELVVHRCCFANRHPVSKQAASLISKLEQETRGTSCYFECGQLKHPLSVNNQLILVCDCFFITSIRHTSVLSIRHQYLSAAGSSRQAASIITRYWLVLVCQKITPAPVPTAPVLARKLMYWSSTLAQQIVVTKAINEKQVII